MANILGGIELEEQKGLTSMPQQAASAWIAVEGGIVGANYKPLLYVGSQVTKGMTYWFIAEETLILEQPERHIVKLAVNKFNNEYKLVPHSLEVLF